MKVFLSLALIFLTNSALASFEEKILKGWKPMTLAGVQEIDLALESPSKKSTFTIRSFSNTKNKSLKANAKNWIRLYKSYGFKINASKPFKLKSGAKGFLIDSTHKKTKKNFIQFVALKENQMTTLTCQSQSYEGELELCTQALKTFSH